MTPVRTKPRFRCDFCRRVATEKAIATHEAICWRNPNRLCPACNNTGTMEFDHGPGLTERVSCYFCAKRDDAILAAASGEQP